MDQLKPPGELCLEGNISENWRRWKQAFELFLIACGIDEKTEKVQIATFLHVAGQDARTVYNNFEYEENEDKNKLQTIIAKFEKYCEPRKNLTYTRHLFFTRSQGPTETIDMYVTDLKAKAKDCEFGPLTDSLVRDRIVGGIRSDSVRARLLRESDIPLRKAVDLCRACEASETQLKSLQEKFEDQVHLVKKTGQESGTDFGRGARPKTRPNIGNSDMGNKKFKCGNCGREHAPRKCPAYGQTCHKCSKLNHFAAVCKSTPSTPQAVHLVEENTDFFIGSLETSVDSVKEDHEDDWKVLLQVGEGHVEFKLDTGAQCNVLPKRMFKTLKLKDTSLKPSATRLISYTGHKLYPCGTATVLCKYKAQEHHIEFQIIDYDAPPVLGRSTCTRLGLLQRIMSVCYTENSILDEYPDLFTGLGCLPGKHSIKIDPGVLPVIHPPRRVPVALRDKLRQELDRMEALDVIERQTEPTEWVNSLVIVTKGNKLRVCMDPKDLNCAIKREHYPMSTIDEVVSRMPNATIFTALDARKGFWQIELDEQSSKLCTFNSPFGRYRFKRLPFGISSAPEVYQKVISEIFEGLDGVECIVDDILVWGTTQQQHDERLRQVLERARSHKLRLNKEKCKVGMSELHYVGHIISKDGLKIDPEKIRAIIDMPEPTDKAGVQRFLGMVQYVAKFIPNLSELSAPLRRLNESDVEWHWDQPQRESFSNLKQVVINAPVLTYFDDKKQVTLSVDASSFGLGAALLHDEMPIAYASRALTQCQQRYAQIEKELLAIVYGCGKFHQYLYGRPFVVQTDHKPLQAVFTKPLHRVSPRLQKMLMKLQNYDLTVVYKPGKEMHIADTLSRANLSEASEELIDDSVEVNIIVSHLPVSVEKLFKFREATAKDPDLQQLKNVVLEGWPNSRRHVPPEIRCYWPYRDEIAYVDNLLFKAEKLIVPRSLQRDMLDRVHEAHLGIVKCKQRARQVIFWPGMSQQIEDNIAHCETCIKYRNENPRETLLPHDLPNRPWAKVGVDLFELHGDQYLLCVDYFSKYPEVALLPDLSSKTTVTRLKSMFARHGIPDEVISDNGPQFASAEFAMFASQWEFNHTTSSPGFAQSNGQSERTVQTVKKLLLKALDSDRDPYLSLLVYRDSPLESTGISPAQMLMGRRLKTRLPISSTLLSSEKHSDLSSQLKAKQMLQKQYFDAHAHDLPDLHIGERVQVRKGKAWQPAVVIALSDTPRSYIVRKSDGREVRRNRKDLLKAKGGQHPTNDNTPEGLSQTPLDESTPADSQPVQTSYETPQGTPDLDNAPEHSVPVPDLHDNVTGEPISSPRPVTQTRSGRTSQKPRRLIETM